MAQDIWCVVENGLRQVFSEKLRKWGFNPYFITAPDGDENNEPAPGILNKSEEWLERWAKKIVDNLTNEADAPLLFIQAELAGKRSDAIGIFLAELVWCEKICPTIIGAIDLQAGQRDFSPRARKPDRNPIVRIQGVEAEILPKQSSFILWDVLSGDAGFQKAVDLAVKVHSNITNPSKIKRNIFNSLIATQTALYRHQLGSTQASLRIMEGAYRQGWLLKSEVLEMISELTSAADGDNLSISNLKLIRQGIEDFKQKSFQKEWFGVNELLILVCDDEWKRSGWSRTLPRIIKRLFNIDVIGTESIQELEREIANEKRKHRIVTLLLDVHYSAKNETSEVRKNRAVGKKFLQKLNKEYPLMDIILFTSDLKLGWLVREAYRLDYRVFFKELDEQSRSPKQDASELMKIIEDSVAAFPVRAVQYLVENGFVNIDDSILITRMRQNLKSWRQSGNPAVSFSLSPLLERQYRLCCEAVTQVPDDVSKRNIWDDLTSNHNLNIDLPAAQLWKKTQNLATRSRNLLVHNPNVVLEANSILPSIGLTVPIVISINCLHQIGENSIADKLNDYLRNVNLIFDALFMSNQIRQPKARKLIAEARKIFYSGQFKKESQLYSLIVDAVDEDDKNVFALIGNTLKNREAFSEVDIKFGGRDRVRANYNALRIYRRICVLITACLLDFNNHKLMLNELPYQIKD